MARSARSPGMLDARPGGGFTNHQLNQIPKKREYGFGELLRRLKRVEYIKVVCPEQEKAFWYPNLTEVMRDQLKAISPESQISTRGR